VFHHLLKLIVPGILVLSACSPWSPTEIRIGERLIPEGEYADVGSARFYDVTRVAVWDFSDPDEISKWTPERIDTLFEASGKGLKIRTSSSDPSLFRTTDLDASKIKALRICQAGLTSDAYIQIYWAGPGEAFSEEKTLGAVVADLTGKLIPTYSFNVQEHPGWTGRISSIRIDPTSVADHLMEIYSMEAVDFVINRDLVGKVCSRPWLVDISGDARPAILTPPGFEYRRTVRIPKKASLDFSIGLDERISVPVTFEILKDGSGGSETVLFRETMTPVEPAEDEVDSPTESETDSSVENGIPTGPWYDRNLDLRDYSGDTVDLVFRTSTEEELDLFNGFPAWAGMEILAPVSRKENPRKNVVMIIVDTLRADHLSSYGWHHRTSPNIDAWAANRGVLFEKTVAAAPWTIPSHASIFSGLDCLSHGVNNGDPAPPSLTTLAEILAENGYATRAVTGGTFLTVQYGLMQGFDVLEYWSPPNDDPEEAGNDLVDGIEKALSFLDSNTKRPFFLLFHTYEVHTPYRRREPFFTEFHGEESGGLLPPVDSLPLPPVREKGYVIREKFKAKYDSPDAPYQVVRDGDLDVVRDLYDSGIAFADQQIGRLLDRMLELGLEQDTIVVFTGDHGESLGEHGRFEHKEISEETLLVPLVISTPDSSITAGSRVSTQVRLIDVMPTILDLAGIEVPENLDGRSLVPLMRGQSSETTGDAWSYAPSSNSGIALRRNNAIRYLFNNTVWPQVYGKQELYDLLKDPGNDTNIAQSDPRTPVFLEETRKEFETRTSGVRVLFSNQMDVPMEAHLKGYIVDPVRVKGFGVKTEFLEWRYQMLNMVVPAGHSMVFHLEGNPFGELYVTARFDVPSRFRTGIKKVADLGDMAAPWQGVFDGSRWIEDPDADLEKISGIRLWIEGESTSGVKPVTVSEEDRALLKKLGYLQ